MKRDHRIIRGGLVATLAIACGYIASGNAAGHAPHSTVAVEDPGTTRYQYDALGNLRAVSLPDGTKIEYLVDGLNRRIGRKVNGQLVQGFLWQGRLRPIAELDGDGKIVSQFVYATGINVPGYMKRAGKTFRLITDDLGSVRLVVDVSSGEIAQRLDYNEYGVVLRDTKPGFQPFGFAGGLYDPQTKLVRLGARDYDGATGRWLSKDPIGLDGGSNLYQYASSDPVNLVDPRGLQTDLVGPLFTGTSGEMTFTITAPAPRTPQWVPRPNPDPFNFRGPLNLGDRNIYDPGYIPYSDGFGIPYVPGTFWWWHPERYDQRGVAPGFYRDPVTGQERPQPGVCTEGGASGGAGYTKRF